jgi:hypothetical protein
VAHDDIHEARCETGINYGAQPRSSRKGKAGLDKSIDTLSFIRTTPCWISSLISRPLRPNNKTPSYNRAKPSSSDNETHPR